GNIKIDGNSFEYGMIPVGSIIECEYTFSDSGNIEIKITVPSVGITLNGENFYNRLSGQIDFENDSAKILDEAQGVLDKVEEINGNLFDEKLDEAANKLKAYLEKDTLDAEELQTLFELTQESKRVVASFMKENKAAVWQQELNGQIEEFEALAKNATPAQLKQVNNLKESIQKAIDANNPTAEKLLNELQKTVAQALFNNNDEIFIVIFQQLQSSPQDFTNPALFRQLVNQGNQCLQNGDLKGLKSVVSRLVGIMIRKEGSPLDEMLNGSGITK
ncbi:MAG: hypothetical protein LBT20_07400, partial [Clostridiales bacterium]|nr:hypothetical protein [Clostridiales bacterium]